MSSLLFQTIDQLSREKGIEPQIIISAVEDAILVAARKYYKTGEELRSEVNRETGQALNWPECQSPVQTSSESTR